MAYVARGSDGSRGPPRPRSPHRPQKFFFSVFGVVVGSFAFCLKGGGADRVFENSSKSKTRKNLGVRRIGGSKGEVLMKFLSKKFFGPPSAKPGSATDSNVNPAGSRFNPKSRV